nr:CONSTANS-like 8 [Mangifera indica]
MGYISLLRSPKKEEEQVLDTMVTEFVNLKDDVYGPENIDIMDELEGIWGFNENDEKFSEDNAHQQLAQLSWDFMHREKGEQQEEEEQKEERSEEQLDEFTRKFFPEVASLNLNLNYQEVLDAWSDRGPLWADEYSLLMTGEVPVMEEEKARREASVLRYKEKRQTRLFSKKIRYQVRKLNADKRPRLKGRFVKRVS